LQVDRLPNRPRNVTTTKEESQGQKGMEQPKAKNKKGFGDSPRPNEESAKGVQYFYSTT
jgi:hypothetical protein